MVIPMVIVIVLLLLPALVLLPLFPDTRSMVGFTLLVLHYMRMFSGI